MCFPERFTPLEIPAGHYPPGIIIKPNSAAQQLGIISNGVKIMSYCALGNAYAGQSEGLGIKDRG